MRLFGSRSGARRRQGAALLPFDLAPAGESWDAPAAPVVAPAISQSGPGQGRAWLEQIRAGAMVLALSVCSYWIVSSCLVSIVVVQGRSMEPTLQDGSQHLLNRLAYLCRAPERGELVVLRDPGHGDCAVKRIVALPGESVELKDQRLYVNGRRLAEPYLRAGTATRPRRQPFPFRLGRDQYFVLGDNRSNSEDSRIYGAVSRGQILGCLFE